MIWSIPVVLLILALMRLLAQVGADMTDVLFGLKPEVGAADWTVPLSAVTVGATSAVLGLVWAASGVWLGAFLAALAVGLLALWPVVRWAVVRTGSYRLAYRLTRIDPLFWASDRVGGPLFAAAWAVLRGGGDAEGRAWVEARLPVDEPLTPAAVGAAALLALARGDRQEGRAFLEAVSWFDERVRPATLDRLCAELRVADAASRGDWVAAADADAGPSPTNATELIGGVARRLLGRDDAEDDDRMRTLWWLAPRLWGSARPWIERRAPEDPVVLPDVSEHGPLTAAMTLHRWLLAASTPDLAAVEAVARRWDDALVSKLEHTLRERANVLGARRSDAALDLLRDQVQHDLAAIARRQVLPLPPLTDSPTLAGVVARIREEHLTTLELAGDRLRDRLAEGRSLPPIDELREWLALRQLYAEGVIQGGDSLRRLVFRPIYEPLCSLSVALYNDHDQRWLSNAMTRWLLSEARLAGDAPAVDLQTRNLQAGG